MSEDRIDGALRDDIRLLGRLLGESLTRQAGSDLLDLVEHVRAESKAAVVDPDARGRLTEALAALDLPTGTLLGRAFLAYFHLANIAEQVHRADELTQRSTVAVSALERTVNQLVAANLDPAAVADVVARLDIRPVLTAHPTESSRRSILTLRRRVATLLRQRTDARSSDADRARAERRLAELVDLLWQTEEVRRERPTPLDEAGATLFYLDELAQLVVPDLLDDLSVQLRRLGAVAPDEWQAVALRHLGRRRPRRQPVRDAGDHADRPRPPARARRSRLAGIDRVTRRAARGLDSGRRRVGGAPREPRSRPPRRCRRCSNGGHVSMPTSRTA